MSGEFIVRGGSYGKSLYIVLEGEAYMVGMDNQILGIMVRGAHFSNDLLPEVGNFEKKRTLHIVTKKQCIVGAIHKKDLKLLYEAYPAWKL